MSKNLRRRFLTVVIRTFSHRQRSDAWTSGCLFSIPAVFFPLSWWRQNIVLIYCLYYKLTKTEREEEKKILLSRCLETQTRLVFPSFFLFPRKLFLFLFLKLTFSQAKRREDVSVDAIFFTIQFLYSFDEKKKTSTIIVAELLRKSKEVVETPSSCSADQWGISWQLDRLTNSRRFQFVSIDRHRFRIETHRLFQWKNTLVKFYWIIFYVIDHFNRRTRT